MLKKIIKIFEVIVKQLAIAFFFSSLFVFIIGTVLKNQIDIYISLINKMTIIETETTNKEIQFDSLKKRLISYPNYGSVWATLKIPDIEVEAPVYHGDTLDIIKYGIGHYAGSYFPGEGSSIILAAHNSREHFMYLPQLKIGAEIIIEASYGRYTYQVIDTKIIKDTDEASLPIQTEKELLMMYTCYPVNTIGHKDKRYVVYAKLIEEVVGDSIEK